MEWNTLIENRYTNYAWQDREIPQDIIKDVLLEVYNHVPTKNLKFPYVITTFRNNNPELRKEIATICHRNADLPIEKDKGNPQVLAPTLFAFSRRDYKDLETAFQKTYTWTEPSLELYGSVEIGVVATFLMLALTNRGIQTGFCQNIGQDAERASEIFGTKYPVRLLVAAGYGINPKVHYTYLDPRTNTKKEIPYAPKRLDEVYKRPNFKKIFKFVEGN
tara:strand:- start:3976 stop:4632 length:657 start_codon:yes stop_codon:yes gene_type:complete